MALDTTLALRAAIAQALGVLVEDWGWIAGPGAWMLAAAITATVLRLPLVRTLCGAALAGIPSALATIAGLHWLGAALAIVLFALWCGGPVARGLTGRTA